MNTSRRNFIGQAARLAALATALKSGFAPEAAAEDMYGPFTDFRDDFVRNLARDLAAKPFVD